MAHFLLAYVTHDGLTDIGVIKENILCCRDELGGEYYQQHRLRWYVYTPASWNQDVHFSGRVPERYRDLPAARDRLNRRRHTG